MLYEITVPYMSKTLGNLQAMLDKSAAYAEEKKFDVGVLLQSRLAPDQFNLLRQVQIACDTAKLCAARLTGKDAPVHDDSEKTLDDVRLRIRQTLDFLGTLSKNDFEGAETRKVTQPRWEGKYLLGEEFVHHHAIPNFYFHVMTAYSILRHNGVAIGKRDYLGEIPYKK